MFEASSPCARSPGGPHQLRRKLVRAYPAAQLTEARARSSPIFKPISRLLMIEVFSGCGRLARAFAARGFDTILWDVALGEQYNLLCKTNEHRLLSLCCSAHYVHFAPPCSSFSIARGAHAPRSRQFPMGKPGLSEADQTRVVLGNRLMFVTVRLARALCARGISWTLEQPQTSRMWICNAVQKLLKQHSCHTVDTVFCAWGTPWRKATRFCYYLCPGLEKLARSCHSPSGHCCFTHRKHQILQGQHSSGVPWTRIAQPYPSQLCKQIALLVSAHFMLRHINKLDKTCLPLVKGPHASHPSGHRSSSTL
jgi:hypothetical protein